MPHHHHRPVAPPGTRDSLEHHQGFLRDKRMESKMFWRIISHVFSCFLQNLIPTLGVTISMCNVYWKTSSHFLAGVGGGGIGEPGEGPSVGRASEEMGERKCVSTHFCSWAFSSAFTLDPCCRPPVKASQRSLWLVFRSLQLTPSLRKVTYRTSKFIELHYAPFKSWFPLWNNSTLKAIVWH